MRILTLIPIVLTAACGGATATATDPGNTGAGGGEAEARYSGPPVVEITADTGAVTGAEPLAATMHDRAVKGLEADGTFATDGGPPAYHVAAKLESLTVTPGTPTSSIACALKIMLMTAPEMEAFGFINSSATVAAQPGDELAAEQECVSAVIDDLVAKKVLPALKDRMAGK
jgi:hypothetical protein